MVKRKKIKCVKITLTKLHESIRLRY